MNKIKIFSPVILLVVVGMLALSSCEKAEVMPNSSLEKNEEAETTATIESYDNLTVADMPQLEVRDGMLYFANSEQYFKTIAIVGKMTDEQLDQWEQKLGFVSLRTIQNKVWTELESSENEQTKNAIITKHEKYVEITDDKNVKPIVEDLIYSSIANKEGMFLTEEIANKISKTYLIIGKKEKVLNSVEQKTNDHNLEYFKYFHNGSKSCDLDDVCFNGARRCFVNLNISRYIYYYTSGYRTIIDKAHVHVWGEKKMMLTGWVKYKTNLSFWAGEYGGDKRVWNNGWAWGPFGYYNNWTGSGTETKDLHKYRTIGIYSNLTSNISWPVYRYVRMTASSRGVGNQRAVLFCE